MFRKSKDNHHLKLAILTDVLCCAVKLVALHLQQVKLSLSEYTENFFNVIHFSNFLLNIYYRNTVDKFTYSLSSFYAELISSSHRSISWHFTEVGITQLSYLRPYLNKVTLFPLSLHCTFLHLSSPNSLHTSLYWDIYIYIPLGLSIFNVISLHWFIFS